MLNENSLDSECRALRVFLTVQRVVSERDVPALARYGYQHLLQICLRQHQVTGSNVAYRRLVDDARRLARDPRCEDSAFRQMAFLGCVAAHGYPLVEISDLYWQFRNQET